MSAAKPSLVRAAKRIELAARALTAAASDLYAVGATSACEVIAEEADRATQLAEEVHELRPAAERPAPGVVF
jgi:hypothetical protein